MPHKSGDQSKGKKCYIHKPNFIDCMKNKIFFFPCVWLSRLEHLSNSIFSLLAWMRCCLFCCEFVCVRVFRYLLHVEIIRNKIIAVEGGTKKIRSTIYTTNGYRIAFRIGKFESFYSFSLSKKWLAIFVYHFCSYRMGWHFGLSLIFHFVVWPFMLK